MFQAMGKLLRDDPTSVTAEMSAWLSNQDSPALWAPFAFSIRGFAYEVMDECELARSDYNEGLNLYDTLEDELGEEIILRMINNVKFMRVRLGALPPPPAISPVESYFEMPSSEVKENIPVPDPVYQAIEAPNEETGAYENAVGEEGEWEAEKFNETAEDRVEEQVEEQAEEYVDEQAEEHVEEQAEEHVEAQAEEHVEEQAGEYVEEQAGEYVEEQAGEYVEEQAEDYGTSVEEQADGQAEQTEEQTEEKAMENQVGGQPEGQEEWVEERFEEQAGGQVEEQTERQEEEWQAEETANQDQTFENWEDDVIEGQENENGLGEGNEAGNGAETQITQEEINNQEGEFSGENINFSDESTIRGEKETLEEVPQDGTVPTVVLNSEAEAEVLGEPENADVSPETGTFENLE